MLRKTLHSSGATWGLFHILNIFVIFANCRSVIRILSVLCYFCTSKLRFWSDALKYFSWNWHRSRCPFGMCYCFRQQTLWLPVKLLFKYPCRTQFSGVVTVLNAFDFSLPWKFKLFDFQLIVPCTPEQFCFRLLYCPLPFRTYLTSSKVFSCSYAFHSFAS